VLGFPVTVAARLGMGIGLQDMHFAQWDRLLGVHVPGIVAWTSRHRLESLSNKCYFLLFPLMQISIFLPILAGKVKHAQQFLAANLVAFALGLPVFALLPGIGPWYGYHLAARPDQAACQALIFLVRLPGPYLYQYPAGVICFPSFHVIWAILCVQALWVFRPLRMPVSLLSGLIIFSTLSVGNHYFCDVLAGILLAAVAIVTTKWISRRLSQSDSELQYPLSQ
jgi:membrane-associated phospholipid phosphatase